jgi:hypothetical protein
MQLSASPIETRDVLLATQDATSVHENRAVFLHRPRSDLAQSTNSFAHITSAPSLGWRDSWDLHAGMHGHVLTFCPTSSWRSTCDLSSRICSAPQAYRSKAVPPGQPVRAPRFSLSLQNWCSGRAASNEFLARWGEGEGSPGSPAGHPKWYPHRRARAPGPNTGRGPLHRPNYPAGPLTQYAFL